MTELMLRPNWPSAFRRTVRVGKKGLPKTLVFLPQQPVEVSDAERLDLAGDIGVSLFEVERDEKGRPRYVEAAVGPTSNMETPVGANL